MYGIEYNVVRVIVVVIVVVSIIIIVVVVVVVVLIVVTIHTYLIVPIISRVVLISTIACGRDDISITHLLRASSSGQ